MVNKLNHTSDSAMGACPTAHASATPTLQRGRPRDPQRLRRVLDAAQQEFLRGGYEGASIDAIARVSGISKVTIYKYFPSKEALFEAAAAARVEQTIKLGEVGTLDPRDPYTALMCIGRRFLELVRSPDVLAHHRMLFGASSQHPAASRSFYEGAVMQTTTLVANYLRAAHEADAIKVTDPVMAADQFLALFLGNAHIAGLLGLARSDMADDQRLLEANVELLLRGYA